MRSAFISLSVLSLGAALVVLGPATASAHDSSSSPAAPLHKRTSAGITHRRVVNSRRAELAQRDEDALAALKLFNSTLTQKVHPPAAAAAVANAGGDPSKALAGGNSNKTTPPPSPPPPPSNSSDSSPSDLKFPDLGFQMPSDPPSDIDGWWTDNDEYAFLGFSYEVTSCELPPPLILYGRHANAHWDRSKRIAAQERLLEHPKQIQRPLCPPLRRLR